MLDNNKKKRNQERQMSNLLPSFQMICDNEGILSHLMTFLNPMQVAAVNKQFRQIVENTSAGALRTIVAANSTGETQHHRVSGDFSLHLAEYALACIRNFYYFENYNTPRPNAQFIPPVVLPPARMLLKAARSIPTQHVRLESIIRGPHCLLPNGDIAFVGARDGLIRILDRTEIRVYLVEDREASSLQPPRREISWINEILFYLKGHLVLYNEERSGPISIPCAPSVTTWKVEGLESGQENTCRATSIRFLRTRDVSGAADITAADNGKMYILRSIEDEGES